MNEENNQNVPILGETEPNYPSGTYKIKFSDEYYLGQSDADEQINGRIMLLQNDGINNGDYFMGNYKIYDDVFIEEYVSHFDTERPLPILDDDFYVEHAGQPMDTISDYQFIRKRFAPDIEYHFVLDEEWYNKHYGEDSNKVLRTLATGQSDITRHEAYTKVQGLNWANANTPQYEVKSTLDQMLEIVKRGLDTIAQDEPGIPGLPTPTRPVPEQIVLLMQAQNSEFDVYNSRVSFIALKQSIPDSQFQVVSYISSRENEGTVIGVEHNVNPDSQIQSTNITNLYFISATCTGNSPIDNSGAGPGQYVTIPEADFAELIDISKELANTEMDLYFSYAESQGGGK